MNNKVIQQIKMLSQKYKANVFDIEWVRLLAMTLGLEELRSYMSKCSKIDYLRLAFDIHSDSGKDDVLYAV